MPDKLVIHSTADSQGLFANIKGGAVIRDLTVRGVATGGTYLGGIVGCASASMISGCSSDVKLTCTGKERVGGIAGALEYGSILDCTAEGTVSGTDT